MLKPNFVFDTFLDITPEFLFENHIKALLLDVDNTLTGSHKSKVLRDGATEWFDLMHKNGIDLVILSNAKTDRAKAFAESIGLDFIGMSAKPLPFGFFKAAKKTGWRRSNIAMVGDQIFTDILGANISGVISILVTKITPEESLSFRIRRKLEKRILKE